MDSPETIAADNSMDAKPYDPPGLALSPWYRDRFLCGILAAALLLGIMYNYTMVIGKGPDEPRHIAYIQLLFNEHTLPHFESDGVTEHAGAHTLHPPLYYALQFPLYVITRNLGNTTWHIARLLSLFLCLAALVWIYQIALRAGKGDRVVARLTAAQIGLLPIFGMTAGTVNNDSASLCFGTLFLWLLVVKFPGDRSWKAAFILGVCAGLGNLSKANTLLCDLAALVAYLLAQDGRAALTSLRSWGRFGIVFALAIVVALPWHLYSLRTYGTFIPVVPLVPCPFLPNPTLGALVLVMHDHFLPVLGMVNVGLFYSLWSQKDWIPESVRTGIYVALFLYVLTAVFGHIVAAIQQRKTRKPVDTVPPDTDLAGRIARWGAYTAFATNWIFGIQVALFRNWAWQEGGRYLLPALCGFSLFLALGWRALIGPRRLPITAAAWVTAMLALNGVCIYWLITYLNPTFGNK